MHQLGVMQCMHTQQGYQSCWLIESMLTTIGDTTVVYWVEDGEEIYQYVFAAVSEPMTDNLDIVDAVFKNLKGGKAITGDTVLADCC